MEDLPKELLTVDDVAKRLRVSKAAVYRWAESGRLKAYRVGSLLRFSEGDLVEFIRRESAR